jgi:small subunit ribosomal protein S20
MFGPLTRPGGRPLRLGREPRRRAGACYHRPARGRGRFLDMANIRQQKKRVRIQARQRLENLRYRSTIKTLTKRLEAAAEDGDADRIAAEHRDLVSTIDRATARGALHGNTAARKKSQAAKIASGTSA